MTSTTISSISPVDATYRTPHSRMCKMKSVVIYLLLFVSLCELLTSTNSEKCTKTILYKCDMDKKTFRPNCTSDQLNVEILKYSCESKRVEYPIEPEVEPRIDFKEIYPNLRTLDISNGKIEHIDSSRNESRYVMITKFIASNNKFDRISSTFYRYMPKLEEINFSNNEIYSLTYDDFNGVTTLTAIDCSHNPIERIENITFSKLQHLERLDLSNNRLQLLRSGTFVNNTQLKWLNLRNNPLWKFDFSMFSKSVTSITVHLPSENIGSLDVSCRDSPCLFTGFDNENNFENITFFNASGNHLVHLTEVPTKLGPNLSVLDLSHCSGSTFEMEALKKYGELKGVYLSNTTLSKIPSDVFNNNSKLINLSLSYDNLTDDHTDMFSRGFRNLESLDLQGNQFEQLDEVITPENYPKLNSIGISGNNFHCEDLKNFLEKWATKSLQFINNSTEKGDNVSGIECHSNGPNHEETTIQVTISEVMTTEEIQTTTKVSKTDGNDVLRPNDFPLIKVIVIVCVSVLLIILIVVIILVIRKRRHLKKEGTHKKVTRVRRRKSVPKRDETANDDYYTKPEEPYYNLRTKSDETYENPYNEPIETGSNYELSTIEYQNVSCGGESKLGPLYSVVDKNRNRIQVDQLYSQVNKKAPKQTTVQIDQLYAEVNKPTKKPTTYNVF